MPHPPQRRKKMENKEITAEAVFTAYENWLEKISEEGTVEQNSYRQFIETAHDAYGRPSDSGIVRLFAVFASGFLMGMAVRDAEKEAQR